MRRGVLDPDSTGLFFFNLGERICRLAVEWLEAVRGFGAQTPMV